uniref:uncharacterized protein LOC120335103 n=1 Tax=Styela clava TaxID=7725 RepID=UPI00193ABADC|nr:uncharacterized protein LOC120335103 [Styela clava]
MNLTILVIWFSILITSVSAQDPWKKECVDGFELLFFKQRKTYNEAKSSCEGLRGYLAKVDDERITRVINSSFLIQDTVNTFYIGGNDIAIEGDWKWQDGTHVIMRGEVGYENWKSNQPNNVGNEDCLAVGRETYEWIDISCDEIIYYICQKGGATLSAESSSIIQYKNTQTCVISWILSNKTETGDSYTVELNLTSTLASSRDSNLKTDMKLINVTSSSVYSFQPESNRNYSASIKIFSCDGFGQVFFVTGICLGKPRAPTKVFPPDSFEDNLVSRVCGFKKLGIQAPDETNGLVSCLFVLVRTNLKEHDVPSP